MTPTLILSSLGGIIAFVAALISAIRWVAKLVDATEENTEAMGKLSTTLTGTINRVDQHDIDIAVLKDRINR